MYANFHIDFKSPDFRMAFRLGLRSDAQKAGWHLSCSVPETRGSLLEVSWPRTKDGAEEKDWDAGRTLGQDAAVDSRSASLTRSTKTRHCTRLGDTKWQSSQSNRSAPQVKKTSKSNLE
jgi:hypothetical protein